MVAALFLLPITLPYVIAMMKNKLTTTRLVLTPLNANDWPFYLALRQNPDVMKYMAEIDSEDGIRQSFERLLNQEPGCYFIIREQHNPQAMGDIGLNINRLVPDTAAVGYSLLPEARGKGYAYEALSAVCQFALNLPGIKKISALALKENLASIQLLEKAGFRCEIVTKQSYLLNGHYYDDCEYRLYEEDFRPLQQHSHP
ncbi:RimJ/RimL family protein N-acetyltransferase [Mangrovibacter plantisponsor]|uniref:RimJ/RimL family protein N-acetyltransferase n=2 Tax=Mangrovibacter plantisponsor TaxID=451513 RepID=A0A317PQ81_9ENTR|nr:RimJ/RimL family protein N-acetyltransferase [Mangrovibacter plantisponsor]